jgi:hypothetical protein
MKKYYFSLSALVVFSFLLCAPTIVQAQSSYKSSNTIEEEFDKKKKKKKKKKKSNDKKEQTPFQDKLWYGANLQLGGGFLFGQGSFGLGFAPMVGYKIVGPLSVGPRVSILYQVEKQVGFSAVNLFNTGVSGFARCKVFRGLFVQGELGTEWFQVATSGLKATSSRPAQVVGAGWNYGGGAFTSEFGAFYNFVVANDLNTNQSPLEIRFGFTYKF